MKSCDEEEKKTEHTNITRSSLKTQTQNIHVMLFYAIIIKNKINQTINQVEWKFAWSLLVYRTSLRFIFEFWRKKNGAHKHLSSSLTSLRIKIFTSCCLMQIYQKHKTWRYNMRCDEVLRYDITTAYHPNDNFVLFEQRSFWT